MDFKFGLGKKQGRKGFTLAELLIVVAIIAVLVAVSVPIFSSQLKKARLAVDHSAMRDAYALVQIANNMQEIEVNGTTYSFDQLKVLNGGSAVYLSLSEDCNGFVFFNGSSEGIYTFKENGGDGDELYTCETCKRWGYAGGHSKNFYILMYYNPSTNLITFGL